MRLPTTQGSAQIHNLHTRQGTLPSSYLAQYLPMFSLKKNRHGDSISFLMKHRLRSMPPLPKKERKKGGSFLGSFLFQWDYLIWNISILKAHPSRWMLSPGPATPRALSSSGSRHDRKKQEAEAEMGKWLRTNWTSFRRDQTTWKRAWLSRRNTNWPSGILFPLLDKIRCRDLLHESFGEKKDFNWSYET